MLVVINTQRMFPPTYGNIHDFKWMPCSIYALKLYESNLNSPWLVSWSDDNVGLLLPDLHLRFSHTWIILSSTPLKQLQTRCNAREADNRGRVFCTFCSLPTPCVTLKICIDLESLKSRVSLWQLLGSWFPWAVGFTCTPHLAEEARWEHKPVHATPWPSSLVSLLIAMVCKYWQLFCRG